MKNDAGYFVGVLGRTYHLDGSGKTPQASDDVFERHHLRTFQDRFDFVDATGQENIAAKMKEFFDQRPADKPYFLWVNFSDPHHPWNSGQNPPAPASVKVPGSLPDLPGVRADLSSYMGEIEHMDGDFQRVLDIIKERASLDNTLIIFTGDNGMAFPSGKGSLHDPGLNVPLLAWWPGIIKPAGDSRALISGEDIAPTCLEAAGIAIPQRITGQSFLPLLRGQDFQPRKHIFAERGPHGGATFNEQTTASSVDYSRAVRSDRFKLIYNVTPHMRYQPVDSAGDPSWQDITKAHEDKKLAPEFEPFWFTCPRPVYELYDLESDPAELHNLANDKDKAAVVLELKTALQEKMITDFDYLPLPIPTNPTKGAKGKGGDKGKGKGTATNANADRAKQFLAKDTNLDGRLSPEEFGKNRQPADAAAWFKARDTDQDGFISQPEFTTNAVAKPPGK